MDFDLLFIAFNMLLFSTTLIGLFCVYMWLPDDDTGVEQ